MFSYPWTTVKTNINGAPEKNEIRFGEFKCSESRRQRITIDGIEILKEVRIYWASINKWMTIFIETWKMIFKLNSLTR